MNDVYINNLNIIILNQETPQKKQVMEESKKKLFSIFKKHKEEILTEKEARKYCEEFICPYCGETQDLHFESGHLKGIIRGGTVSNESGDSFFDCNLYHRYGIHCYTCDSDFESPRFQYNK